MTKNKPIPVIFRVYRGEITAYFPTLAWSHSGGITCYAHVGQHGEASRACLSEGRPATEEEAAPLMRELRGIYGRDPDPSQIYELAHVKRAPSWRRRCARWFWE